jgi:hypothetical protein
MTQKSLSPLPAACLGCCVLLGLSACRDPVQEAQRALQAKDPMSAFRLAREALRAPALDPGVQKRLGALVHASAVALLDAPDQGTAADARELWSGLPPDTEERTRAAQRLFRVTVKGAQEAVFRAALEELEAEMGDQVQVRANLRTTVQLNRGTPVAVTAAQEVVKRWPEDSDRWVDLAAAQAAVSSWEAAQASLLAALVRLDGSCRDLPARMQGYDKVRKESAYGELEQRRCQSFHRLVAQAAAYARQGTSPRLTPTDRDQPVSELGPRAVACPPEGAPPRVLSWEEGVAALALAPPAAAWWVDGERVTSWVAPVPAGGHQVTWRAGTGCQAVAIRVDPRAALALRLP